MSRDRGRKASRTGRGGHESGRQDLAEAFALHNRGQLDAAESIYQGILRRAPKHPQALRLLGVVALQRDRPAEAVELLKKSLRADARQPLAHSNLGAALLRLRQPREALQSFDAALALDPNAAMVLNNRGNALMDLDRPQDALMSYERALQLDPNDASTHNNAGSALRDLRRFDEALASFSRALQLRPAYAAALRNCGHILLELKRPAEALDAYRRVIEVNGPDAEALFGCSNALREMNRFDEAQVYCERSLEIDPKLVAALIVRGNWLLDLRRFEEALGCYTRALALEPNQVGALNNRGTALFELGRFEDALGSYEEALGQQPDHASTLNNLAMALMQLQRPQEASSYFERLIACAPQFRYAPGKLMEARLMCCDWREYESMLSRILEAVGAGRQAALPYAFLAISESPEAQLQCARVYAADRPWVAPPRAALEPRAEGRRLKVAYLSADFRDHPVSHLLVGVLERHDRSHFEIIGISLRPEQASAIGARVKAAFDRFFDVSVMSDTEVAELIAREQVDVVVDLMGYTSNARPAILAQRAAPLQISYLGFPATMGVDFIDYLIADAVVVPAGTESAYAECILRMPDCYLPTDDRRSIAATPTRLEAGLPAAGFVFCAFNNSTKLTASMFELWMRLLRATPGSVLWLRAINASMVENLQREAQLRGVDAERLVFALPVIAMEQHLARIQLADLFLDTLPYNAHATACDFLWAGVPVLTCLGRTFAGRVAASALTTLGLSELVAPDLEAYERLALKLAHGPSLLAQLRAKLAAQRMTQPLFDTDRRRRQLESAYTRACDRHRQGQPPTSFAIEAV